MHWLCGTCLEQTLEAQVERAQERTRAEMDVARRHADEALLVAEAAQGSAAFTDCDARARQLELEYRQKSEAFARGSSPACPLCATPVMLSVAMTRGGSEPLLMPLLSPVSAAAAERPTGKPSSAAGDANANAKSVAWSAGEDAQIVAAVAAIGHKWRRVAEGLPGRTHDAVRNRHALLMRKRAAAAAAAAATSEAATEAASLSTSGVAKAVAKAGADAEAEAPSSQLVVASAADTAGTEAAGMEVEEEEADEPIIEEVESEPTAAVAAKPAAAAAAAGAKPARLILNDDRCLALIKPEKEKR